MSEQRIILKAPKTKKKIARSKDHGMYGMVRLTPEACDILENLNENLKGEWNYCQLASQIIINAVEQLIYDGDSKEKE